MTSLFEEQLAPYRKKLKEHELYTSIKSINNIELDTDEHGPLSLEMVNDLCGSDKNKWYEALDYSKKAMEMRIKLWDGILEIISKK